MLLRVLRVLSRLALIGVLMLTSLGWNPAASAPAGQSFTVSPGQAKKLEYEGASLELGGDAVLTETTITITPLHELDLPALDQGMANATLGPRRGYRFLPHNLKFNKKITVRLPYDPNLIPAGLTAQDLRTFFFDDQMGRWQELERVEVDTRKQVVVSLTDHFTDVINATITIPDHPQALSYNPTSIKDIKAADPGAGINLVQAPGASSTGDARLVYPIEVPPGRSGMQPRLGVTYNSGTGNGWLGLGWEMAAPAITIDTRWGVPRYDPMAETETYLLNGEQLTPLAHRGAPQPRAAEKTFRTRVEGQFQKIVRHGDHPSNYWWEVTDKTGTTSMYGGPPGTDTPDDPVTLADASGNLFTWALREVRDLHGNGIRYTYDTICDRGVIAGCDPSTPGVDGYQLYLKHINYTQSNGSPGAYTVTFIRDSELPGYVRRPDVMIDARGGFKRVTAELLKRVEVLFNSEIIRSYEFTYREGAFRKTLLESVAQFGEDGTAFYSHEFSYHQDSLAFGTPGSWTTGDAAAGDDEIGWKIDTDNVAEPLLSPLDTFLSHGRASALSGSVTDSLGGHVYLGFNPTSPSKQFSGGGKVGFNYSNNAGVLAFVDINGDSLPDKVFKNGSGQIFFRLNQSGPVGGTTFGAVKQLTTLPAISEESSVMTSFGLEAYFGANAFVNQAETFTTNATYFVDANADGLLDLVHGGRVLFNHLDSNGVPVFEETSATSPVPIASGTIDTTGIIENYQNLYDQQVETFPLQDTIRRWVAPFDGTIQITGDVTLHEDLSPRRAGYQTADGVRVAIQHNLTELWSTTIGATDYSAQTPSVGAIAVTAGDAIYFRVQSVFDGAYDQVRWDPQIFYTGVSSVTDVNGLDPYRYQASVDFVLAGRRDVFVKMPLDGSVRLEGTLRKLGITTDDITLLVFKNGVEIVNRTLRWDQIGDIVLAEDIDVLKEDEIKLRIKVDSPIDLQQLQWTPRLYYTATNPAQQLTAPDGSHLFQLHPPYDIDLYPVNTLSAPQQSWTVPRDGTISVTPHLSSVGSVTGLVIFTVKRQGALLAKHAIQVNNGIVSPVSFTMDVVEGDRLYFDFSSYDPNVTAGLDDEHASVRVYYTDEDPSTAVVVPSAFHSAAPIETHATIDVFPQAYRGWAVAGYNGNAPRDAQPIDPALLVIPKDQYDTDCERPDHTEGNFATSGCNPVKDTAYMYNPFPEDSFWRGPDDFAWVSAGQVSSSRVGIDAISVPVAGDFAGASGGRVPGVPRLSRTSQTAVGLGAVIASASESGVDPLPGFSYGEVDYLDMNGDQLPDILGNGRIQYTFPTGALETNNRTVAGFGRVRESDNDARTAGLGGTAASFKANGKGEVDSSGKGAPKSNTTGNQMVTLGLGVSASVGNGRSDALYDLLDVNGDGLPDRVSTAGSQLMVALNLGYRFAEAESWGSAAINDGASANVTAGPSLGFNAGIYDFAGGLSLTANTSFTACQQVGLDSSLNPVCDAPGYTLLDINGDGLLDRITQQGNDLKAAINTGNGFAPETSWPGAFREGIATSTGTSLGGGVYFTIGVGPLCVAACYIIINPGADYSRSMARQTTALRDVNGDGYADHVLSTSAGSMQVARNETGRTNLLKAVTRPLGATIELDYERSGNTYDQPQSQWVLSKVVVNDGHTGDGVDTQVTMYRYEDGVYDRLEREFYGYGRVVEEQRDASNSDALYRAIVHEFATDSYYTRGLLQREVTEDRDGRPYIETAHTYTLRDVETGTEPANPESTAATVFPQLVRTDQRFFEGNATAGKSTHRTYRYDAVGNLIQYTDAGDADPQDDVIATIGYSADDTACQSRYIVGVPTRIVVMGNSALMRQRQVSIDCPTGTITQVRQYLDSTTYAQTDLAYFTNGNLKEVIGPANKHGQRYRLTYGYDPIVETHIQSIVDSFGYASSATHNLKYGIIETATDINRQTTSYTHDVFGRVTAITGPYEQGGTVPTIRFEYHHDAAVPWALTKHLDRFRDAADPIETVLFTDGLKRVLQTKKDGSIHAGTDTASQTARIVSGRITFDFVGRVVEQYYPVTEATAGSPGAFNTGYDAVQPTRMTYDILDRTTTTTIPDGTTTSTSFGFGADRSGTTQFMTTMTDANGNETKTYRNVRDLITSVQEFNTPPGGTRQEIWTSYAYDPLQQLVEVRDDRNNITMVAYDDLGRRTNISNPDAGATDMVYDLAGNVIAKITATLRAEGKQITYDYDFTRLKSISYPNFAGNNVTYAYGGPGASDNRAGRITLVIDESGQVERFYGKLGEITKEIKTVATDTGGRPEVYTTQYVYDTFGRLQTLTYPDGEVLAYRYDAGGLLREAVGQKGGVTYSYINRLEYDKFEQRTFVETGNGVRTQYRYDAQNRRLANLQAGSSSGQFQNLDYQYDNVGNILSLANNVPVPPPSRFGGPTSQTFQYDDLYRLVGAQGSYQFAPDKTNRYSLSMAYDTIHNILAKTQTNEIIQPSDVAITQHKTTYDWTYAYDGPQPHAPTHIDNRTFHYDANGNQVGWDHDLNGTRRTIIWDEENRIQSLFDNGHEKTYKYNDAGERVIKRGPQGETVYVNQYFTIRNRQIGTKHIYAGDTRAVSKLVKRNEEEKDRYFYHPDHLGSSNYVTDASGALYEHLEYFPFGETWVQEVSNTQRTPYLFTAKELDEETGLYYYGARYYDPRTSVFQAADPVLVTKPERAKQSSANLAAYTYAWQNPLIVIDPDGRQAQPAAFRLHIVEFGSVDLSADVKRALTERVSRELGIVTQGADNSAVAFDVVYHESDLTPAQQGGLTSRDFVVYALSNPTAQNFRTLGTRHGIQIGNQDAKALQSEFSAGTTLGYAESRWRDVGRIERFYDKRVMFLNVSPSVLGANVTGDRKGDVLAETTMHEFGHSLGLEHEGDLGMGSFPGNFMAETAEALQPNQDPWGLPRGRLEFTDRQKETMRDRLELIYDVSQAP